MNAFIRFVGRYWKRLLLAAVASSSVAIARKRVHPPLSDVPADTGPIVTEPTFGQRLRNIIPKRKSSSGGGGNGGSHGGVVKTDRPTARPRKAREVFEEPTKRTPIPARPRSKEIAEDAQRARDAAQETARRTGLDGPDFGIDPRRS